MLINIVRTYPYRTIYTLCVLVSAFLLFQIQPIMAKLILPWLGGSPAVWQTVMLFFQLLLLGGYLYVHLTHKYMSLRAQTITHLIVLLAALFFLPITLHTDLGFAGTDRPITWLLLALLYSVSLPFFVLSASAPLLQRWFAELPDPSAHNPYFLYSASNLGSLLALLGYPFIIEPLLGVSNQLLAWTGLFLIFASLMFLCVRMVRKHGTGHITIPQLETLTATPPPTLSRRLHWLLLAFIPSSLMLGVTTYLTTDIAAVPLLWVIPLALYLFSFVLCFANGMPGVRWATLAFPAILIIVIYMTRIQAQESPLILLLIHLSIFFVVCMGCHGQLASKKPSVTHLTEYFVWMSLGGALGGMFNALIAPAIFTNEIEYFCVMLIAIFFLIPIPRTLKYKTLLIDIALPVVIFISITGMLVNPDTLPLPDAVRHFIAQPIKSPVLQNIFFLIVFTLAAGATYRFARALPIGFFLCCATMLFISPIKEEADYRLLFQTRNFYGISSVMYRKDDNVNIYRHGTTLHGLQSQDKDLKLTVTSYYAPLNQLIAAIPQSLRSMPMAITGLGAGTLTCLATPGQELDLYEIDRAVVQIATDPALFTYMRDCPGVKNIIVGDARIKLQEADNARYGLMLMDAYTSDSLPVHLMTKEALALYLQKLRPEGIIAFHISNRNLDLKPILANLAVDADLIAYEKMLKPKEVNRLYKRSQWVIMTRAPEHFGDLNPDKNGWKRLEKNDMRLWTDDFSNIVSIFK